MRICVLGASSISTPHLARYLARQDDIVPLTLVLAGRTPERVAAIARAARIVAERSLLRIETADATAADWKHCLSGAEMVVVQVRVGGYAARQYDETFPLEFDLCGDEGLGAGGLAAAWRTWPVLRDILRDVRLVCPSARIVLLTSPLSLLVRIARFEFPDLNLVGICELPFTTLDGIARTEGRHWSEMEWQYLGINHIGWLYGVRNPRRANAQPLPAVGLKYLRLEEAKSEVLASQKARPGERAAELAALAATVIDAYARGDREEIDGALSARPAEWYQAAVGPLVAAQAGGRAEAVFFLSLPQGQWCAAFEPDDVLEVPHVAARNGLTPRPNAVVPPPENVDRLLGFLRYERAAARAVFARNRSELEHALSLHPWIPRSVDIRALASRVCGRHALSIHSGFPGSAAKHPGSTAPDEPDRSEHPLDLSH